MTPWGHRVPVPAAIEWGRDMSRPHKVWSAIPDCRCCLRSLDYNSENYGLMAAGVSYRPEIEASISADKEHQRGVKHFPASKSNVLTNMATAISEVRGGKICVVAM
jgi:hypothetical protein